MSFMDSYKRLERLCGDVMGDDRRVSAYIDEMVRLADGSRRISGWDSDLKQLKHYRWARNQIAHEPDCYEEELCGAEDVEWIENFYDRIMTQTDPLALYRRATRRRDTADQGVGVPQSSYSQANHGQGSAGCALYLLGILGACLLMLV